MIAQPKTSDDLRRQLAAEGVNTQSKAFRREEEAARAAAAKRYREICQENDKQRDTSALVAKRLINAGLNWASTIVTGMIMVVGLITALAVVVAVEIAAVESGLRTTQAEYTTLYAVGLVFIYLVLAFYLEAVQQREGSVDQEAFSLRTALENLKYFLGFGRKWSPRYRRKQSEVSAVKTVMNLTLGAIIFFGVLGRVPHLIENAEGAWHQAIARLITASSLSDMIVIAGTLFAMAAALLGTRKLVSAVYIRFYALTGGMENDSSFLAVYSIEDLIEEEISRLYEQKLIQCKATPALSSPNLNGATATSN